MKMFLVGIFDRKAQMFISLEPTPNINVSLRQLTETINTQKDSPLHKWAGDYSLWELGGWDNESGRPWPLNPHEAVGESGWFEKKLIIECESLKQQD